MAAPQDRLGKPMGEYRLLRLLGQGAFGAVYLAEHIHDGSQAAVKLLQIQLTHAEDFKAFLGEARTIRLRHPHIVPLLDFGLSNENQPFLVMEYAAGGTLRDRHARGSRLPLSTMVNYVRQMASALQYAHERRVIHRDVKPENMLVRADGNLLLSDFGIATVAHSSHSINLQQGIGGTLPYMAPEQIQGQPRPQSDQYALAVVTYEWITGQRPFQGTAVEMAMQHAMTAPPSLLELVPTLPRAVEQIVLKALAKDPKERFASIEQFAQALQAVIQSPPISAHQDIPTPPASPSATSGPFTPMLESQSATAQPTLAGMPVETVSASEQSQESSPTLDTPLPQSDRAEPVSASTQTDLAETLSASGRPARSPLTDPTPSSTRATWTPKPPGPPYASPARPEATRRSILAPGTRVSARTILMGTLAALVLLLGGTGLWTVGVQLQNQQGQQGQQGQQATATAQAAAFATATARVIPTVPATNISEFPVPTANSNLVAITSGSDGNLWFTEFNGDKIGRISLSGTISEFPVPTANSRPNWIAGGPDGNLWFTEQAGRIGRISPNGAISEFPVPTANSDPIGITSGSDGNVWFTEFDGDKIGRISLSGTISEFPVPTSGSNPIAITAGPDGNFWFTEWSSNRIGRITSSGSISEFPVPTAGSNPSLITAGPDGNLWFIEWSGNKIGRISPNGTITEFPIPTADSGPSGIASGPDGNLWFTEYYGNQIGRISPNGKITEFLVPTANSRPNWIASGRDGNLWFIEKGGNKIGRITSGK